MRDGGGTKRRLGHICPAGSGGGTVGEEVTFASRV